MNNVSNNETDDIQSHKSPDSNANTKPDDQDNIWCANLSKENAKDNWWNSNLNSTNENPASDSWDTMEADEDFWSSDNISQTKISTNKDWRLSESDLTSGQIKVDQKTSHHYDYVGSERKHKIAYDLRCDDNGTADKKTRTDSKSENTCTTFHSSCVDETGDHFHHSSCDISKEMEKSITLNVVTDHDKPSEENGKPEQVSCGLDCDNKEAQVVQEKQSIKESTDIHVSSSNKSNSYNKEENQDLPLHPYCIDEPRNKTNTEETDHTSIADGENDNESDIDDCLVIDDSDVDDCTVVVKQKPTFRWKPVLRTDAFHFNEPLILSFEEVHIEILLYLQKNLYSFPCESLLTRKTVFFSG